MVLGRGPLTDSALTSLLAQLIERWPGVHLTLPALRGYLREHVAASVAASEMAPMHLTDMALACACLHGDGAALSHLSKGSRRWLEVAIGRQHSPQALGQVWQVSVTPQLQPGWHAPQSSGHVAQLSTPLHTP